MAKKIPLNIKTQINELFEVIEALDTLFEVGEDCIHPKTGKLVSNSEYDAMKKKLIDLLNKHDPNNEFLTKPSISKVVANKKIKHIVPMVSISKANGTLEEKNEILSDWILKAVNKLKYKFDNRVSPTVNGVPVFAQSFKRDGVAISLNYENGILVSAGLRDDTGLSGEDVTENAKHVDGVLEKLPLPITCSIRGEVECKISTFEKLNKELSDAGEKTYANPRNYTAGSIRQFKDPTETKRRKLSFTAYSIEGFDNAPYKTAIERAKWGNQTLKVPFVRVEPFEYDNLKKMEDMVPDLDYEVDGVVIEVNNLEDQEQMGRHGDTPTGNPLGKLAWKFEEQSVTPEVKDIMWQTGRQGKVTPVLMFDPVKLAGTMVRRCTAHNVGIIKSSNIGVGAIVKIIKSGKIIPKVIGVVKKAPSIYLPKTCPSCGSSLNLIKGDDAEELYCENDVSCPAQNIGRLSNYLSVIGVKGIAESLIEQLIETGRLKNISDFYKIKAKDLIKDGFTERTATLIEARIKMVSNAEKIKNNSTLMSVVEKAEKPKISAQQFIAALGIENAGKGTGRALSGHFSGDIQKLLLTTKEELEGIAEVGPITANSVYEFLKEHKDEINETLKYVEIEKPKTGKLTGKTFVFTGTFPQKRNDLQKMVEDLGGKAASSVGKKVDYVCVGSDAGSKEQEAIKLGIKRITIEEFFEIIK